MKIAMASHRALGSWSREVSELQCCKTKFISSTQHNLDCVLCTAQFHLTLNSNLFSVIYLCPCP
jgi:hypothetical protein